MQQKTVSLRTFLVIISLLSLALIFGLSNIRLAPATVGATADAVAPLAPAMQETTPAANTDAPGLPTQDLLSGIYDTAVESVVNIQVRREVSAPFDSVQPQGGEGTGWIWDEAGHIVTNNHVVEGATDITVNFVNGMWAKAELIARDPQADLAVIRIDPPTGITLRPLETAAVPLKVGHYTIALGSPFGLDGTMTLGIVSALGRSFAIGDTGTRYSLPEVIQTDAAINPGNSGGPLLNLNGKVVGVNFAIRSEARSNSGVGFAIPVSVVKRVVPALISEGAYQYPFLGISGSTITAPVAAQENLEPNVLGVYVAQVISGGPSADAGLRAGDIIISIDDMEVRNFEDLISYLITQKSPGDTVEVGVLRNGDTRTFQVELSARPGDASQAQAQRRVTVGDAIEIAKDAVADANEIQDIEGATAKSEERDGSPVWVVMLEGEGKTATVVVDASTGEVISLEVDSGN